MNCKFAVFFCASACFAQQYEVGGNVGYGVYRNGSVVAPGGTASAGISNHFTAGAVLGEDLYEHISGEVRYLYQNGDPFVSTGGRQASIEGQSHSVSYNMLFHLRDRDSRLRPFASMGAGIRYFRSTGPEPAAQPFPAIVTLTNTNEVRWLLTPGVGVKYRLARHVLVRGDFIDYISPFPHKIFVPAQGGRGRGIYHQFTPMFGLSYWF